MNILCVKLGTKYPSEMVNNLFRMCIKNVTTPFEFFCYTDDRSGIIPNINIIRYVDNGLDLAVYNKLYLFSEEFDNQIPEGPRVYFDLDLVIINNIDNIVNDNKDELSLIRPSWREEQQYGPPTWHHMFNSSCMTWTSPNTRCLWEHLQRDPEMFMAKYKWGMDSFMFYEHKNAGTNIHYFQPNNFCSYIYGVGLGCFRPIEGTPPIILFNGAPKDKNQCIDAYNTYFKRFYGC